MKTSEIIFTKLQNRIHSEEFKNTHRLSKTAFIRNCVLSFTFLFLFILNQLKKSNAAEIDSSNTFLGRVKKFTKSALSKARTKISPNAFIELNNILIEEFYVKKSNINLFCNLAVFAIDGSKIQLPESNELRSVYGATTNQTSFNSTMGRASQLVDVTTGIIVHAILSTSKTSEKDLAMNHINEFVMKRKSVKFFADSVILFDRGYPGVSLIAKLIHNKINFLMRCNTAFIKEINDFVSTGKKDGIVKVNLMRFPKSDREEILNECPGIDLKKEMLIRVVIVVLDDGTNEILLTSLLDEKKYKYSKFKKFYFMRWGIETVYGFQKIRLELENFSGKTKIAVEQDFHATILNFNMTTVLAVESKKELDKEETIKHRKYEYNINYSIAFAFIKNRLMNALLNLNTNPKSFCAEVKALMIKNLEPVRPGRKFEHKRRHPSKRYPTNNRAVLWNIQTVLGTAWTGFL